MSGARAKSKTVATWLALIGGTLGLHRFYLRGPGDWIGWLHPLPTALGWWGVDRVLTYGQDDKLSWVLIPLLGMSIAISCLTGIVFALTDQEKWNRWFNPDSACGHPAGATHWLTIGGLVFSVLVGTVAFMGTLAFGIQHYFEYQIEEARKISQPDAD
ncbi:MAG: TM2 domain-containing protein [Burkholderiales bacterium]|nr:MAG: TM2 domain-containing protein [Burkholderiales bacterium]